MTENISHDDLMNMINTVSTNKQGDIFDQEDVLGLINKNFSSDSGFSEGSSDGGGYQIPSRNYNIKIYDFKGTDKFSKDQLRTIHIIHETFARSTSTFLSAYLRKSVSIHLAAVDQITYEQFIKTVSSPSTLAIVDMSPLSNSIILELSPTITFVIIDRIFGGEGDIIKHIRELSDIELSVIHSLIVRLLSGLRESWSGVVDIRPRLEKIESDIQFIQIVPHNDTVILVRLDVSVGESEGMINFCIPYIALDSVMSKLSAKSIYGTYKQERVEEKNNMFRHVMNLPLEIAVSMGKVQMQLDDIMNLKEGDYLSLDRKKNSFFDILVGDDVKFKGAVGKKGKKLVTKIISIRKEQKSGSRLESMAKNYVDEE